MPGLGICFHWEQIQWNHTAVPSRAFETFVTYGRSSSLFLAPEVGKQTVHQWQCWDSNLALTTDLAQPLFNNICPAALFYGAYLLCEAMLFKSLTSSYIENGRMDWALMLEKVTGFKSQQIIHELREHELIFRYLWTSQFIYKVGIIRNAQLPPRIYVVSKPFLRVKNEAKSSKQKRKQA